MAGATLPSINAKPPLHFILNLNERNAWPSLHSNSTMWCCLLSTISLSFLLMVNLKIYFKKEITNKNSKVKKSKTNVMKTLILISFCKILLICIIFHALKNPKAKSKEFRIDKKRLSKQAYFLSPEYYKDIYKINDDFTKNLLR